MGDEREIVHERCRRDEQVHFRWRQAPVEQCRTDFAEPARHRAGHVQNDCVLQELFQGLEPSRRRVGPKDSGVQLRDGDGRDVIPPVYWSTRLFTVRCVLRWVEQVCIKQETRSPRSRLVCLRR
jgi:hypothetical protein